MKSYIEDDRFVVHMTNDECIRLGAGEAVVDRRNALDFEAKVEVYPYSELDPDFAELAEIGCEVWQKRVFVMASTVRFYTNLDLALYVPQEVPKFSLVSNETIERDKVETLVHGKGREELLKSLPARGVRILFSHDRELADTYTY